KASRDPPPANAATESLNPHDRHQKPFALHSRLNPPSQLASNSTVPRQIQLHPISQSQYPALHGKPPHEDVNAPAHRRKSFAFSQSKLPPLKPTALPTAPPSQEFPRHPIAPPQFPSATRAATSENLAS